MNVTAFVPQKSEAALLDNFIFQIAKHLSFHVHEHIKTVTKFACADRT